MTNSICGYHSWYSSNSLYIKANSLLCQDPAFVLSLIRNFKARYRDKISSVLIRCARNLCCSTLLPTVEATIVYVDIVNISNNNNYYTNSRPIIKSHKIRVVLTALADKEMNQSKSVNEILRDFGLVLEKLGVRWESFCHSTLGTKDL